MTKAEQKVWRWLRNRTMLGLKFRRQHPVLGYVLDFYCPELKLCVEVDGGVHDQFGRAMYDAERSCELSKLGIHVVRVRNEDVLHQPNETWDFIVRAVVRILCERSGRSQADVLPELYGPPQSPLPTRVGRGDCGGQPASIVIACG